MGSCWNRDDMSFNGSATSWSVDDDEEDEVGDVTSSNESDSNDEPFESSESEEDEEEKKEPTTSYSSWNDLFFCASNIGLFFICSISLIWSSKYKHFSPNYNNKVVSFFLKLKNGLIYFGICLNCILHIYKKRRCEVVDKTNIYFIFFYLRHCLLLIFFFGKK